MRVGVSLWAGPTLPLTGRAFNAGVAVRTPAAGYALPARRRTGRPCGTALRSAFPVSRPLFRYNEPLSVALSPDRQYLTEEQRRQAGCSAGRVQLDFHHGLLGHYDVWFEALKARVPVP